MTQATTTRRPRKTKPKPKTTKEAIGATAPTTEDEANESTTAVPSAAAPITPVISKAAMILSLLHRAEGASLQQLVDATGWLPHTTRAALTGLKRKGHTVVSDKPDGVRIYRIAAAVEAADVA